MRTIGLRPRALTVFVAILVIVYSGREGFAQEFSTAEYHATVEGESAIDTAGGIPIDPTIDMHCQASLRTYPSMGLAIETRYRNPSGVVINSGWFERYTQALNTDLSTYVSYTGTYTCEWDFYAEGYYLGSDAKASKIYLKEFEIYINTFIPENNVTKPIEVWKVFGGDDRSFNKYGGSRTHYRVHVYAPRANLSNHIISTYRLAGETSEYDAATSLDGYSRLTYDALNDWSWGGDKKLRWATADTSGISCSTFRESASLLRVHCVGNANNPLFDWGGLNDISYDLTVSLSLPAAPATSTFTVEGAHDGFPNYELYLGEQQIYAYDHGGQTPYSLGDGMEMSAYNFGVIW